ncbi:FAD-dependent oxidoreductase [Rhizorhabdus dicambivorans]|uniref:FAD-dependent oxidoreductase n=1 Tax=Rhizorhabdus dicambivorans TaxID=1850238 RepID=UPI0008346244|nr:FAD-dependent oxidoreductase [Rhizorhabdus dicambivorans]
MPWDIETDLVVVGSGGGACCAALVGRSSGKDVLVVEKLAMFGGSTAYSGGIVWVPMNRFLKSADTFEKAREYLDSVIGDIGRASTPAIRDAYVRQSRNMICFLETFGIQFEHARMPDYYSTAPGGLDEGRSILCPLFDLNRLGEWSDRVARFQGWPPLPLKANEACDLTLVRRSWAGKLMATKLAWRMFWQKLTGQRLRGMGNALQGQMLKAALDNGVEIWREAPMTKLVEEGGNVAGIVVRRNGRDVRIRARHGVLLNSGGFSRSDAMRRRYQPSLGTTAWTAANPGDTGEAIEAAQHVGAAIDLMDAAIWVPASFHPDGEFGGFHVPNDAGKPHCIIVDAQGRRFANEAQSYNDFGYAMRNCNAVPAWAIIESRHRDYYSWGIAMPGRTPDSWFSSGYMKVADTLDQLATQCGIDSAGLAKTVARFNHFVANGSDTDFRRGERAFDRANAADPNYALNPCLGAIERGPFYAVKIVTADVGTQGGVIVDEYARVLRDDGSPIGKLYAAGNCTASMTGRSYPGAGVSIGKSFTFAYIAARHAFGIAEEG